MDSTTSVLARLGCAVWGHAVDNRVFRRAAGSARRCRCGAAYLSEDGTATRVRHTLSCFFRHHSYVRVAGREGHHEYVCVRCGHPLLFAEDDRRFGRRHAFTKKVRYLCGLFGHRVHAVVSRQGYIEYACHCGHTFLMVHGSRGRIRHPLICFFTAHRIRFLARRDGYAEYVCGDCGHPFCFTDPDAAPSP
jgi:DNA-directed RNA polymerase subunit RPC12/RpoP